MTVTKQRLFKSMDIYTRQIRFLPLGDLKSPYLLVDTSSMTDTEKSGLKKLRTPLICPRICISNEHKGIVYFEKFFSPCTPEYFTIKVIENDSLFYVDTILGSNQGKEFLDISVFKDFLDSTSLMLRDSNTQEVMIQRR